MAEELYPKIDPKIERLHDRVAELERGIIERDDAIDNMLNQCANAEQKLKEAQAEIEKLEDWQKAVHADNEALRAENERLRDQIKGEDDTHPLEQMLGGQGKRDV